MNDEKHDPDQKQDPGDLRGDGRYSVNAKRAGDQPDDEKNERIVKHVSSLLPPVTYAS